MKLPVGVGLVRVEYPGGPLVMVSDALTKDEEWTARVVAAKKCGEGWPLAVVMLADAVRLAGKVA